MKTRTILNVVFLVTMLLGKNKILSAEHSDSCLLHITLCSV
jgi:hypothetical protein